MGIRFMFHCSFFSTKGYESRKITRCFGQEESPGFSGLISLALSLPILYLDWYLMDLMAHYHFQEDPLGIQA